LSDDAPIASPRPREVIISVRGLKVGFGDHLVMDRLDLPRAATALRRIAQALRDALGEERGSALSQALAASTITRASTWCSAPVRRSMYFTPLAVPSRPKTTSRTIASVTMSRLPVTRAGGRCTVVD